jgi:acyl-CoA-binding protein
MSLQEQFTAAKARAKTLTARPSNQDLLDMYALFKQGSAGDVFGERPGMMNFKRRAMFDTWANQKGMSKTDAQEKYVALVNKLHG